MVTMQDIAKLCKVSRQTVHMALTNKGGVSEVKRQQILEVVRKYNFQPSRLARTLVQKSTNLVGVTILNIRNPFFAELVQGINQVLRRENLHIIFFETNTKAEEIGAIETLLSYQVAGLIVSPIQVEGQLDHFKSLFLRKTPFVTVGPIRGMESHYVEVENLMVGHIATDYLLRKGHKRLRYLEGPETIISAGERALGFLQCLRENRVPFSEACLHPAGNSIPEGYRAALEVLRDPESRPSGLVCFNDIIAVGAYQAAQELGLRIPQDVSIIGCDDIEIAKLLGPPLTTIAVPIYEMGGAAAEMLVTQMRDEGTNGFLTKRFAAQLIERGSVQEAG